MTKQTIGIGSSADDGTGDPLRTAFGKVNDNFGEVYGVSGILKSNGTDTLSAAVSGTDYAAASHTHTASNVSDFSEAVDDRVNALLVAGTGVTLTYDDGAGTLTVAASGSGSSPTTTLGDIIYRGASADQRLAIGSDGQVLKVVSGVPAWATDSTISIDNMTATWNNAGTVFSAIKMDVTDVASQYDSYFLDMRVGGSIKFSVTKNGAILSGAGGLTISSTGYGYLGYLGLKMNKDAFIGFASGGTGVNGSTAGPDTTWYRTAAGIMALRGSGTSAGASLELLEQTAPAAGAANTVRIYAVDNGSGKTQLMALFATGAAQQIAIEP